MALIPPYFLDCVVAIGIDTKDSEGKIARQWIASGFLYGHYLRSEGKLDYHRVFLVTNKHVLEDIDSVVLRFNPHDDSTAREYAVDIRSTKERGLVWLHPDVDAALVHIAPDVLEQDGVRYGFFKSDKHVASKESIVELGMSEGDGIFTLGFPMGQVGNDRNYVIVRRGCLARIRDYIAGASSEILADSFSFPGNSGGPVVTIPQAFSITGTQAVNKAMLLGINSGYLSYTDVAVSQQTGRPRVAFEENSGLASIVPIQYVIDLIEQEILPAQEAERVATEAPVPSEAAEEE